MRCLSRCVTAAPSACGRQHRGSNRESAPTSRAPYLRRVLTDRVELEEELRTGAHLADHADLPAVRGDDLLADVEAETITVAPPRVGAATKSIEYRGRLRRREAAALVDHRHARATVGLLQDERHG